MRANALRLLRRASELSNTSRGPGEPFAPSLLRRALVALVALKVVGIVLVFSPFTTEGFELPKSLFSRATEWLLAAMLALAFFRYGAGILPRTRVHWFVAAFLVANALSAAFAENRYVALYGERSRYLGLTFLADMAVVYVAVSVAFRRRSDWAILALAIALSVLTAVAYALVQYVGLDPIGWTGDTRSRPIGTLGNPDYLAHLLGAASGAAIGFVLFASGWRAARAGTSLLVVVLLFFVGLIATRGAFLGLVAVALALPLLWLRVRGRARALGPFAAGAAVVAVLLVLAFTQTQVGGRVAYTLSGVGTADRLAIYDTAARAFLDRPILGWGPDNFLVAYPHYRQPGSEAFYGIPMVDSAHDFLLQAAATTGVAGLAALVALVGATARSLWASGVDRAPWLAIPLLLASAAYWTHALVTVGTIGVDWIPWVIFGGATVVAPTAPAREPRPIRPAAAALLLGLAVIGAGSGLIALQANVQARRALAGWQEKQPETVRVGALAVELDPGRADYWNIRGLAFDLLGAWALSAQSYAEAVARAPHISEYWSNLAKSRARQALAGDDSGGGRQAAIAAAEGGVAADPNYSAPHEALAEVIFRFGDYARAAREAVAAISLYHADPRYDETAAASAKRMDDLTDARRVLEEALTLKDTATLRAALADVTLRLGDREAARANARRALELQPDNADARRILRILQETGG